MARTYKRDSRGRFAGGGGGSSRGGGRKPLQRGTNRLTRDNAGRITSVGGDGATARGGRLRTASGRQRATVTAKGIGKAPAGTVGRSGRVKAPARVKATGRRAPLTGVNAVVARNPAGFKGLPVSLRSRSEAAAAQRARNLGRLRTAQNSPSRSYITLGTDRGGGVATGSMRIRKGKSEQGNLLTGKTETVVSGRRITMSGRSALGRRAKPAAAAKPARVAATTPQSKRRRLPASARPASTTPKPRGLEQMAVTNRIMNREQAAARSATARIERAQMRNRRLNTMQREIDYRRANPVGGRAARGQATKRLNKAQRKLDQSRGKVFSAIEVNYKPSRKRAEDRLAQLTRAVRSTAGLRAGRRGARYQRSLFGGATVAYNR